MPASFTTIHSQFLYVWSCNDFNVNCNQSGLLYVGVKIDADLFIDDKGVSDIDFFKNKNK
jgi:hypothetical protein